MRTIATKIAFIIRQMINKAGYSFSSGLQLDYNLVVKVSVSMRSSYIFSATILEQ